MKNIIITAVVLAILGGGFFILSSLSKSPSPKVTSSPQLPKQSKTPTSQTVPGYSGNVLAGKSAPFLEFNKSDYEKALSEGKIIVFDFYANWCPICRAEEPALHAGFDGLTSDDVIGFRVNYNDSETDKDEEALAKQFNITYQHTKVILKDGKEYSKSLDSWTKEKFDQEISKAL